MRLPHDVAARELAVVRDARLVRDRRGGELVLGLADEADLRDGVDPEREQVVPERARLEAERVRRGDAPLLGGRGRQAGEADDVAGGLDVRHGRAVRRADLDPAPVVALETGVRERERLRRALTPCGVEHGVGGDLLAARERRQRPGLVLLDALDALAQAEGDVDVAQVVAQASTMSRSAKSRISGLRSTTVTRDPSAANIEANSIPITPAPTTGAWPGCS